MSALSKRIFSIFRHSKKTRASSQRVEPTWGQHRQQSWLANLCPFLTSGEGSRLYYSAFVNAHGGASAIVLGKHTHVRGELFTFAHGGQITIGDYCYVGENTRIWSAKRIHIGNHVLISHNVNIFDSDTHPIDDPVARRQQFQAIITTGHPVELDLREEPVVIEDDALIACQCVILKGVTIGRAAVVGAGSVVTKDVPPYTLVAGNPARIIRKLNVPEEWA
jgi:acetyltransferase-like isoleucine patch superfamily enzyme